MNTDRSTDRHGYCLSPTRVDPCSYPCSSVVSSSGEPHRQSEARAAVVMALWYHRVAAHTTPSSRHPRERGDPGLRYRIDHRGTENTEEVHTGGNLSIPRRHLVPRE